MIENVLTSVAARNEMRGEKEKFLHSGRSERFLAAPRNEIAARGENNCDCVIRSEMPWPPHAKSGNEKPKSYVFPLLSRALSGTALPCRCGSAIDRVRSAAAARTVQSVDKFNFGSEAACARFRQPSVRKTQRAALGNRFRSDYHCC